MEKILSLVRRCVEDYDMIQPGDRVAVGVSGGKDSLVTLAALQKLSAFYPKPFTVEAVTLDLGAAEGREGADFAPLRDYCESIGVPFTLIPTEISHIVFDLRKEKNPCSMCAKMRRGALNDALRERGITKIALGHHFDDAVETFFLSLFYEGRLSCFQPVTELTRTGITQIRPLLYCGEGMVRGAATRNGLPIVKNPCPADGYTKRQEVKELVRELEKRYPGLKERVFGSMQRLPLPAWEPREHRRRPYAEELREEREKGLREGKIFPLTVIEDRYSGVYSGGVYTAWNLTREEVPDEQGSGDLICGLFWAENKLPVGRGDTKEAAVEDLLRRLREK